MILRVDRRRAIVSSEIYGVHQLMETPMYERMELDVSESSNVHLTGRFAGLCVGFTFPGSRV